jgi:hypothetical protein
LLQLSGRHDLFTAHSFDACLRSFFQEEKMSRYDELALKYENFRSRSEQAAAIANDLASAVTTALGAPAEAVFSRAVAWDGDHWSLTASDSSVSNRHTDGRFYFALCLRLASRNSQYGPQIFATLLSALPGRTEVAVRLEDTEPKFSVYLADPSAQEDLVGEIIGVIEDTLDPDLSGKLSRLNIGFIEA